LCIAYIASRKESVDGDYVDEIFLRIMGHGLLIMRMILVQNTIKYSIVYT